MGWREEKVADLLSLSAALPPHLPQHAQSLYGGKQRGVLPTSVYAAFRLWGPLEAMLSREDGQAKHIEQYVFALLKDKQLGASL